MFFSTLLFWRASRFNAAARAFGDYIADYLAPPEFWREAGISNTKKPPPPELSIVSRVMSLGVSEFRAWDMPVGKAHWYASAAAVNAGADLDFDFISDEMMERIRADQEKYKLSARSV